MHKTFAIRSEDNSLINFSSPPHRLLLGILGIVFILSVSLKLHGWSFPIWHEVIDDSPKSEILYGNVRAIRSDDWMLDLPMILAQVAHTPRFPIVNQNIGEGQNMIAPIQTPTRDLTLLFRPFNWGFLWDADTGLSFFWWSLNIGLFYSFFLVLMIVSRNQIFPSIMGSLLLVYSPYFQFWSFHKAQIAIYWSIIFICACIIFSSRRVKSIWIAGGTGGWALAGMALGHIYPPIAVTLGWLLPFALAAFIWDRWSEIQWSRLKWHRFGSIIIGIIIAGLGIGNFVFQTGPILQLITHTTYPGSRFGTGGGYPLWAFFSHNLLAHFKGRDGAWLGNVCEAASFFFLFPLVSLMILLNWARSRRFIDRWTPFLMLYAIMVFFYTYVGFPEWLAKITLFGKATSNRTQLGFGIINIIILISIYKKSTEIQKIPLKIRVGSIALWSFLLIGFGFWMRHNWPSLRTAHILIASLLNAFLAYFWFIRGKKEIALASLTFISVYYTFNFNPIVRGGYQYIVHNPLSHKILDIDQKENGTSKWVVFGSGPLSQLPRMIGVNSLGGYHGHPHLQLWQKFDPSRKSFSTYNQCAFINFLPESSPEIRFESPQNGVVNVHASPLSPAFELLGVKYFLAVGDDSINHFKSLNQFEMVYNAGNQVIYRRKKTN